MTGVTDVVGRGRERLADLPGWAQALAVYLAARVVVAAGVRSRAHLLTWVGASLALQVVWVVWLWRFVPPSDLPP